ncbi:hypothetical protein OMAG_001087 [Candidatus Omnitrophus magneticus]|uniref:Uncharacterized protein n=1 Tax=Candidatus Omnitrophus magneticus TaxID=1609969 RepID=A0A0F0CNX4_9BACT|nr:hypothetical protein OMAG_001748 [Candidatus Omnitrophus magneticus]KJJ85043.1 hypothetical protein OMAG_001087 [Candidatus Omnitrophus magneticus]
MALSQNEVFCRSIINTRGKKIFFHFAIAPRCNELRFVQIFLKTGHRCFVCKVLRIMESFLGLSDGL